MRKAVLDVGQCGFDGPQLDRLLSRGLHCEVTTADTISDALQKLQSQPFDLCLVNRELAFEGTSGLDLVRQAKEAGIQTPIMLVSDRIDAQKEAEALGAVPGFGKSELDSPELAQFLRDALKV